MKTHHVLFLLWFIVFGFWLFNQIKNSNKKYDQKQTGK
jgi:hypothetical protein